MMPTYNDKCSDRQSAERIIMTTEKPMNLTNEELFEIYCNDVTAGDWHRPQYNYIAGFMMAKKLLAPAIEGIISAAESARDTMIEIDQDSGRCWFVSEIANLNKAINEIKNDPT